MSTLLIHHPSFLEHVTPLFHPERPDRIRAIERILELGVTMPPELVAWAEPHHARDDVRAL